METPQARFFRDSPVLELLDFLERLAPFSAPDLILSDPSRSGGPAEDEATMASARGEYSEEAA
jgi:hypothetical protein